jgi:hypothetical protein
MAALKGRPYMNCDGGVTTNITAGVHRRQAHLKNRDVSPEERHSVRAVATARLLLIPTA